MRRLFQSLVALRHIAISGGFTGLGTGGVWSIVVSLFSLDQLFNSTELILSLAIPGLIGFTLWKALKIRLWILSTVAYLTLLVPLVGLGIGGANILQMSIGGALGGIFWSAPVILYYLARGILRRQTVESLNSAGKT
jgi:hypothetical protein